MRYVDPDDLLCEDLVGFFECDTGITGRDLADRIVGCLCANGLDPTKALTFAVRLTMEEVTWLAQSMVQLL